MTELQLIASAFEDAPVPTFVYDTNFNIVAANRTLRALSTSQGLDGEHLIGKTISEAFPFLPSNLMENFKQVLAQGGTCYEMSHQTESVEIHRFPILAQAETTLIAIMLWDISKLKKAHESLKNSEETARALMNASSDSMLLIDETETIIAANLTAAKRLGKSTQELIGMHAGLATSNISKEGDAKRREYFNGVRETGNPAHFTDERAGRVFDISMFPVPDSSGVTRSVAIFAKDITDHKAMLKALEESENRYKMLFQHTPVPTYVWHWNGSDFILNKANSDANKITNGKADQLIGTTLEQLYSQNHPEIIDDIKKCFATQSRFVREMDYLLVSTGKRHFFEVHFEFVPPDDVILHTVDLTARMEAEIALKDSHDLLEQKVAERTYELAAVNEQLRTERESLNQKNIALRELMAQINDSKSSMAILLHTNLHRVTLPILERLGVRLDEPGKKYIQMLRESLNDILSPYLTELDKHHPHLTANEIDLCNLIKSGLTCKEIAEMRGRSEQTILKQRKLIRKKLGLTDEKINLRNYLSSVGFH